MTNQKVVLVTGASSGFGQLIAQKLAPAVGHSSLNNLLEHEQIISENIAIYC
jgi:NAD(P)-dependent dehydrogenase (short-subunit alcohol dehydrogenase family)